LKQFDEVLKYVNELSNTIDLGSTRVRAEALFQRFQRTVDAADRKKSEKSGLGSPGKAVSRRKLGTPGPSASANAGDRDTGKKPEGEIPDISEDLRRLLSREVIRP
jgi:hypothetical protein